ncbi:lipopolysaccharide biosynthesis protein [Methylophilus methylotrophus]|uniref:lipopolysaccharide biosynthesis protein n=1 Tax=Methylophilus methylotrophus TaxID=17 RepID=UPI000F5AB109|nr:oligosaccharide flippase family protein [Methylophilus methylotrophus]
MFASSSKGKLLKHLAEGASTYGFAVVASRLCTFILLPIYWKYLSPADFGIIGIITLTQGFLVPLLGLGLHDTVQRFYPEWNENQRRERLGLTWTAIFIWSLLLCSALTLEHKLFNLIFEKVASSPYFLLGIWSAFCMTFVSLPLSVMRIKAEIKQFSFITAAVLLTQSVFSLFFVVVLSWGAIGYLSGGLLGALIWAIKLNITYWKEATLTKSLHNFKELLTYSLPMVPTTILDGTTSLFDRFFLDKHVSLTTIGLYNVANQLSSALTILNQGLKSAWIPFLYRIMHDRKDAPHLLGLFSLYYVAILVPPALLIALLSKDIIGLFDSRYLGCYIFVPWIILTIYLQAITTAMGRGLDLAKKNGLWPVISIAQVSVSLAALSYFVPLYGAIGAAWSVTIATAVRALCQITLANKVYPRPLYGTKLLMLWGSSLLVYWLGMQIISFSPAISIALKTGLVLIFCLYLVSIILDKADRQQLLKLIKQRFQTSCAASK